MKGSKDIFGLRQWYAVVAIATRQPLQYTVKGMGSSPITLIYVYQQ